MNSESRPDRVFRVTKDNGERWLIRYSTAGVAWERSGDPGDEADARVSGGGTLEPPMSASSAQYVHLVDALAQTAAQFALWWEVRQQRLLNEAQHEEDKRIPWLADMLARWGEVHKNGQGIDLRVTEYLAREASETMEAIAGNREN